MKNVVFDFADVQKLDKYPRHGWATNSQGNKILWFPIMSLFTRERAQEIRARHGITRPLEQGEIEAQRALYLTLRKLVIALRELNALKRQAETHPAHLSNSDADTFEINFRLQELGPLYLDFSYGLLRRVADQLAHACRSILFERYGVVSTQFKNMRKAIDSEDAFLKALPISLVSAASGG